jgi:aminoglycoside phosphotransferase (APT) family kinase protein
MNHIDLLADIPQYGSWVKIHPINKGWSFDKKFYIEDDRGKKMLLRLADLKHYQAKQEEFESIKNMEHLAINIPRHLDFGLCGKKTCVYSLLTWIEGEDAETVLIKRDPEQQYEYGINAGIILRKMHSIPAPPTQEDWKKRYTRKIYVKLDNYAKCGIKLDRDTVFIRFIQENMKYLDNRPQVFHHGDFHTGNLVISKENTIGIIDFNRMDYGDPWEEFNRCVFSWRVSIPFTIGQIHGYFNKQVPDLFFRLMALYIATNAIGSIAWAKAYGGNEIETMTAICEEVLEAYDEFKTYVPVWYTPPN